VDTTHTRLEQLDLRDYLDGQAPFYAGTANVIMQLGRPEVGYGVYESRVPSGDVRLVPRKRARTTITYLAVALLGTDEERRVLRRAVDKQHVQVRSDERSPVRYNAFDRDLQLWVAACLAYGARDFYEKLHGPHDDPEVAEWLYRETGRLGTTLQVPEDMWPATLADFDAYWAEGLEKVSFDATLTTYLQDLLDLKQLPEHQRRGLARFHRWINTGFLPPEFRDALGLSWSEDDQARFDRHCATVGRRNRQVPRAVRNFPFNAMLLDFRVRRRLRRPLV
jgi:uncharacterized protein (DUF2236 family)